MTNARLLFTSLISCTLLFLASCKKAADEPVSTQPETLLLNEQNAKTHTKKYSSDVAQKWLDLQLQIQRISGATPQSPATSPYGMNGNRYFAYLAVGLYEAVVPGMPSYRSLAGQLTDMPDMPDTKNGTEYHWPTCANAALAYLTRNFFTAASPAHKQAITDLENTLNAEYSQQTDAATFQRSVAFGKEVATRIFAWAQADGSQTVYPPWTPSGDPTKWSNTTPNPTGVFAPYWGSNRPFVPGSFTNTASAPPPPYSTDPNSAYYKMVKEVYDISQSLNGEKIAAALYFRDNPGFQSGVHYQSVFSEVMHAENPKLDEFALDQAKVAIAMADAQINCWQIKYNQLVDRPVRYIRTVLGHSTWSPLLGTPPHPEFPSGHSQTGGAFAAVMTSLLGNDYHFTLHTYDVLNMAPRPYDSFMALADDIGRSRVYAGIHYVYSCEEGKSQGMKIAANVLNTLKFKK